MLLDCSPLLKGLFCESELLAPDWEGGAGYRMNSTLLPSTRLFVMTFPPWLLYFLHKEEFSTSPFLSRASTNSSLTSGFEYYHSVYETEVQTLQGLRGWEELYFDSKGFVHQSFIAQGNRFDKILSATEKVVFI